MPAKGLATLICITGSMFAGADAGAAIAEYAHSRGIERSGVPMSSEALAIPRIRCTVPRLSKESGNWRLVCARSTISPAPIGNEHRGTAQ